MATPSTLTQERALVLRASRQMRVQLGKGATPDRPHWNETDNARLHTRLAEKVIEADDGGMSWALAADIANYAAMLADNQARP